MLVLNPIGGWLSSLETDIQLRLASALLAAVKQLPMPPESDLNPYAPPQSQRQRLVDESSPEALRRAHIRHEGEIKAVGLLYALFGGLMLLPLLMQGGEMMTGRFRGDAFASWFLVLLIASGALVLGAGLRRLAPWARIPAVLISGLLGVLSIRSIVGPFINGYVIWLMLAAQGRTVMSPGYQLIVDLTPGVKRRFSLINAFLTLMLVLLIISVLAAWLIPVFSLR